MNRVRVTDPTDGRPHGGLVFLVIMSERMSAEFKRPIVGEPRSRRPLTPSPLWFCPSVRLRTHGPKQTQPPSFTERLFKDRTLCCAAFPPLIVIMWAKRR